MTYKNRRQAKKAKNTKKNLRKKLLHSAMLTTLIAAEGAQVVTAAVQTPREAAISQVQELFQSDLEAGIVREIEREGEEQEEESTQEDTDAAADGSSEEEESALSTDSAQEEDEAEAASADSRFDAGDGTAANPYQIKTAEELQEINEYLSAHYVLAADIDLGGEEWTPIENFAGSLDGGHYEISNLTGANGLFASTTAGSLLNNITLRNVTITGTTANVGALVGTAAGNITNAIVDGAVTGTTNVGGLVGNQTPTAIINTSTVHVSVNGTSVVGGLVGLSAGPIHNSSSYNTVTGHGSTVGGLVGNKTAGNISNSYAMGDVTVGTNGAQNVGGLVGQAAGIQITNSYAKGNVLVTGTGTSAIGGLIGTSSASLNGTWATGDVTAILANNVGGLVGNQTGGSVTRSYATGTVHGNNQTGGLVGQSNVSITNAYFSGASVMGNNNVGGILGLAGNSAGVSSTYAATIVRGNSSVAGILGAGGNKAIVGNFFIGEVIANSTWGIIVSANNMANNDVNSLNWRWLSLGAGTGNAQISGTPMSAEYLQTLSSYTNANAGWNFSTIWIWDDVNQFPKLGLGEESNPFPFDRPGHALEDVSKVYAKEQIIELDKLFEFTTGYPTDGATFVLYNSNRGVIRNVNLENGSFDLGKLDVGTYQIAYVENGREWTRATVHITPKTLTWTQGEVREKQYDGTTKAYVKEAPSLNGVLDGDEAGVHVQGEMAHFAQANVKIDEETGEVVAIEVTGSDWGIAGDLAGNYTIAGQPTFAPEKINPRVISDIDEFSDFNSNRGVVIKKYDGYTTIDLNGENIEVRMPRLTWTNGFIDVPVAFDENNFSYLEYETPDLGANIPVYTYGLDLGSNFELKEKVYDDLSDRLFRGDITDRVIESMDDLIITQGRAEKVYDGNDIAGKGDVVTGASARVSFKENEEDEEGTPIWIQYDNLTFDSSDAGEWTMTIEKLFMDANILISDELLIELAQTLYTGKITPKEVSDWGQIGTFIPGGISRAYDGTTTINEGDIDDIPTVTLLNNNPVSISVNGLFFDDANVNRKENGEVINQVVKYDKDSIYFDGMENYTLTEEFYSEPNLMNLYAGLITPVVARWEDGSALNRDYDGTTEIQKEKDPVLSNLVSADGFKFEFRGLQIEGADPGNYVVEFETQLYKNEDLVDLDALAQNYVIEGSPTFGNVFISRRTITKIEDIEIIQYGQVEDKTYDGTPDILDNMITQNPIIQIAGAEEYELTGLEPEFESQSAGKWAVHAMSLSDEQLQYYNLSDEVAEELKTLLFEPATINPKELTLLGKTDVSRDWDGTATIDVELALNPAEIVGGDANGLDLIQGKVVFESSVVGSGVKKTNEIDWELTGDYAGNYELVQPEFIGKIEPLMDEKAVEMKTKGTVESRPWAASDVSAEISTDPVMTFNGLEFTVEFGGAEFENADIGNGKTVYGTGGFEIDGLEPKLEALGWTEEKIAEALAIVTRVVSADNDQDEGIGTLFEPANIYPDLNVDEDSISAGTVHGRAYIEGDKSATIQTNPTVSVSGQVFEIEFAGGAEFEDADVGEEKPVQGVGNFTVVGLAEQLEAWGIAEGSDEFETLMTAVNALIEAENTAWILFNPATISGHEITELGDVRVKEGTEISYTREYDGTLSIHLAEKPTLEVLGLDGDWHELAISELTVSFVNKNVGTAKDVIVSGFVIENTESYMLDPSLTASIAQMLADSADASITPRALTWATNFDVTREWNGSADITGLEDLVRLGDLVGIVEGDSLSLLTGTASFVGADAGSLVDANSIADFMLNGHDAGNYTMEQPILSGMIEQRRITSWEELGLSAGSYTKVYDGTTAIDVESADFTAPTLDLSEFGGSAETVITLTGLAFETKNVGSGFSSFGLSAISFDNQENLDLSALTGDLSALFAAAITPRTLSWRPASFDVSRQYDGTTAVGQDRLPTLEHLEEIIEGDRLGLSGTASFTSSAAGSGLNEITGWELTGTESGNYAITQPEITGTITQKTITSWEDLGLEQGYVTKVYDGTTEIDPEKDMKSKPSLTLLDGTPPDIEVINPLFDRPNVGSRTIKFDSFSFAGMANYDLSALDSDELFEASITEADLDWEDIVRFDGSVSGKIYDATTAVLDYERPRVEIEGKEYDAILDLEYATAHAGPTAVIVNGYTIVDEDGEEVDTSNFNISGKPSFDDVEIEKATLTWATEGKVADNFFGEDTVRITTAPTLAGFFSSDNLAAEFGELSFENLRFAGTEIREHEILFDSWSTTKISGNYVIDGDPTFEPANILPLEIDWERVWVTGGTVNDKVYDGTTTATIKDAPVLNISTENGEDIQITLSVEDPEFANQNAGTHAISASGWSFTGMENYEDIPDEIYTTFLTQLFQDSEGNDTQATISQKELTWTTGRVEDKSYDGTNSATVTDMPELTGFVEGENLEEDTNGLTYTLENIRFVEVNAGEDRAIAFDYELVAPETSNYIVRTEPTFAPASIRPMRPSTWSDLELEEGWIQKTYDGTTTVNEEDILLLPTIQLPNAERIELRVSGLHFESKDAGNQPVRVGSLTFEGMENVDLSALDLSELFGTASITRRSVTFGGSIRAEKVFDGHPYFSEEHITVDGASDFLNQIEGDTLELDWLEWAVTHSNDYEPDTPHYTGTSTFSGHAFVLAGSDADNYELIEMPDITTIIAQAPGAPVDLSHVESTETTISVSASISEPSEPIERLSTRQASVRNVLTRNSEQSIVYAISADATVDPNSLDWQSSADFTRLAPDTTYYVFAKTAESRNYTEGPHEMLALKTTADGKLPDPTPTPVPPAPESFHPTPTATGRSLPIVGDLASLLGLSGGSFLAGLGLFKFLRRSRKSKK